MANWSKVDSIELDMEDPWEHKIKLFSKEKRLLESIKAKPNESFKVFQMASAKMQEAKKNE
jgi:hypothetical protein